MKTEYTISKERHDEICKLELEAIKERDSLRADNDHLRQENERLKGEVEAWRDKYKEEYRIVDRVWKALGITSYYHAQPNAIWEHVSKLNSTLATYKAAVVEAREALDMAIGHYDEKDIAALKQIHPGRAAGEICAADVLQCHDALHTLSALTGDATKTT